MSRASEAKTYPSAIAVERAVDVLAHLAEHGEATVHELSRALGFGRRAVERIVAALEHKELIERDLASGSYRIAWGIVALARPARGAADLRTVARPRMARLRDLTGETITLGARSGSERLCIEQVEGLNEMRWVGSVGQWSPLWAGATGRAILAALSRRELEDYLDTVHRYSFTARTLTERAVLLEDVRATRAAGFSLAQGDRVDGLVGISAPIFDASGAVTAAITIGVPANRVPADPARWGGLLREAADEISALLGYAGDGLAAQSPP